MNRLIKVEILKLVEVTEKRTYKNDWFMRVFTQAPKESEYDHRIGYKWAPDKIQHFDIDSVRAILREKDSFGTEFPFIQFGDGRGFVINRTFEQFEYDLKCMDIKIINLCK